MLALLTFDVSSGVSILVYLAIGVGCLVAVHVRAPHEPKTTLLLMVPLWPVLAATALGIKSGPSGDVMARLDRVLGPRERKALDGFHAYLRRAKNVSREFVRRRRPLQCACVSDSRCSSKHWSMKLRQVRGCSKNLPYRSRSQNSRPLMCPVKARPIVCMLRRWWPDLRR